MTGTKTIGFIGTGVMGKSMAAHLLKAGYNVLVFNRTKSKTDELVEQGAEWKNTIAEIAEQSDAVITMLGYPSDVEEVYLGENGLLNHARSGAYLIDMTTSKPKLAEKISREAKKRGLHALDAPVSGGDLGAQKATLTIMVGGEKEAFDAIRPILQTMGENIVLQGKAGSGQHTKMSNQIMIASNMMGVCESLVYAEKAGLDPENVLKSIAFGAAGNWSLSHLGPKMLSGHFDPGFYVKHFIKDMTIALESAEEMGMMTPGLRQAKALYEELAAKGEENSGTQSLYKLYR